MLLIKKIEQNDNATKKLYHKFAKHIATDDFIEK